MATTIKKARQMALPSESTFLIHPEKWGAKAVRDPRGGSHELAKDNSRAFAAMLSELRGVFGDSRFISAIIAISGWYPICEELKFFRCGIKLLGKCPAYGGSGFKWIGPTKPDESMIHISGSDFFTIDSVGFYGQQTFDKSQRMLSAIRTSWQQGTTDPQRRLRFENININDSTGHFGEWPRGYPFVSGIFAGGPGSTDGNDDFFVINNINIGFVESGIKVAYPQAVQWTIDNYGCFHSDCMYHSERGGSFVGRNWYPQSYIHDSVIACSGGIHEVLHVDLHGFSSEHLRAKSLVSVSSSLTGQIQGHMLQASGLSEGRNFWLLDVQNHCRAIFSFQDLHLSTTQLYGASPVRMAMRFGPDSLAGLDYRANFRNCRFEAPVYLSQKAGPARNRIEICVDERRTMIRGTSDNLTAVIQAD